MRFEVITVGLSFAVTSLYWLIAAFRMSAANYGHMMQLQAFIFVVTAIFSLRTHDLVFYLHKAHSCSLKRSFNFTQILEIALVIFSTATTIIASLIINKATNSQVIGDDILIAICISFLANITIMQGSSIAYLRAQHLDINIAWSDFFAIGAWSGALFWLTTRGNLHIFEILGVGFAAAATKPILLLIISRCSSVLNFSNAEVIQANLDRKSILYFLLAGQFTNMMKNSLVSLETLLLGRLVSAESVAVFRIARSFLGLTTAMLNISYQKTYRELVKCKTLSEIELTTNLMNRNSVKLWAFSIPLMLIASSLFSNLNGSATYDNLSLMTLMSAATYLPIALQQTFYARLSLAASFGKINMAYVIGTGFFLIFCLVTTTFITLPLFIFIIGIANFTRLWIMRNAVRDTSQ